MLGCSDVAILVLRQNENHLFAPQTVSPLIEESVKLAELVERVVGIRKRVLAYAMMKIERWVFFPCNVALWKYYDQLSCAVDKVCSHVKVVLPE
jgi:hypothetical protein